MQGMRGVELCGNGREVLHMRPDNDGLAEIGGLQNVVAAAGCESASHEDRVAAFKQCGQFADGVEQQHAGKRERLQGRAANERHSGAAELFSDGVKTLGLARGENQEEAGVRGRQLSERGDDGIVLIGVAGNCRRHGAGGDPDFRGLGCTEEGCIEE